MKYVIVLIVSICALELFAAPQSDELIVLHHVTTAEMNAIGFARKRGEQFGSPLTNYPAWFR